MEKSTKGKKRTRVQVYQTDEIGWGFLIYDEKNYYNNNILYFGGFFYM